MSEPVMASSIVTQIAAGSVGGAIFGAHLNGWWSRRSAKKEPKTEMRAEAYRDFVVYVARLTQRPDAASSACTESEFCDIKARLLLFGESAVVNSVSQFLTTHRTMATDLARRDFAKVVKQMRKSLLTGSFGSVIQSVESLLSVEPPRA